ncbi:MAG: sulfite exporter TauE/SafE family protein [Methanothrix sp.]|nr:sulfite exporter TauE/SafE family protein [Methanothrix harundinacea]MDD3710712.1 sulfite exporter TauE/SafE family protein [Methanothrix sp.]MDD5768070.1 sulfite exporter TauE/SafE family protein [Methanothrix sp.]MDI9398910.1 sulfite exporter TauE/SafE family protein [Euryarchaeota archaeon]
MELVYALVLMITGVGAGFASGMLGVGGCFIMVPVQFWALTSMGVEPTLATRISFGTALAVALPTAINGACGHHRRGAVDSRAALLLGTSGLVGAFFGGVAAAHAPGNFLRTLFGLVIIAAAVRMGMGGGRAGGLSGAKAGKRDGEANVVECRSRAGLVARSDSRYLILGLPLGFLCGLIGIGGGVVMVPVLSAAVGFGMHRAIGTSTAAIILTSSGGVVSYIYNGLNISGLPPFSLGYVNLLQWALLAGTSIPMAWVGVRAAHRISAERLRAVFILLLIYMGLRMMGVFDLLHLLI